MLTLECKNCGSGVFEKQSIVLYRCTSCSSVTLVSWQRLIDSGEVASGDDVKHRPEPSLEILQVNSFSDGIGNSYILGLCQNTSPYALDMPQLKVEITTKEGAEPVKTSGFARKTTVMPGEQSTFNILCDQIDPVLDFKIFPELRPSYGTLPIRCEVVLSDLKLAFGDYAGEYVFDGKVTNLEERELEYTSIYCLLYDKEGKPLRHSETMISDLKPGEPRDFSMSFQIAEEKPESYLVEAYSDYYDID